ncbi:DUF397 domain-containing protein [Streptomyces sp. NBC_01435]|uniref:DUF397 domain-containing protein n=1 Tax=Streptomyces sp. NBC_01435 TaxID=2903865 RepID=UPI002E34A220|nr:DUF397 domain-containing protein [Streptomyces sp. NBC_01435]
MSENLNLPASDLATAIWHTSSYSGVNNNCVEHAALVSGRQAVRDSKDRGLGAQVFGPASWRVFVAAVCDGVI